jgi:hypothetical protein
LVVAGLGGIAGTALAESGDVNGDGRVDERDIRLVERYLDGELTLQDAQIAAADADRDGKITPKDRDLLRRRLGGVGLKASGRGGAGQLILESTDSGTVTDRATGRPLAGVEVSLPDEGITVRTDARGHFRLPRAAPGKILTARASTYVPKSMTLRRSGGLYELQLEQLTPQLTVVDDNLYHLGNDDYDPNSANALQFRKPSIGGRFEKTFDLQTYPSRDLTLRIGSLIGVDTPESVAAGQSGLTDRRLPETGGLRIFLNGSAIARLTLNGDDLAVTLPRWLLQKGANRLLLSTDPDDQNSITAAANKTQGGFYGTITPRYRDLDDVEFAHLVLEDPTGSLVGGVREQQRLGAPSTLVP